MDKQYQDGKGGGGEGGRGMGGCLGGSRTGMCIVDRQGNVEM